MTTLAGSKGALFPFSLSALPTPRLRGGDVPHGVGGANEAGVSEAATGRQKRHESMEDGAVRRTGVFTPISAP